MRRGDIYLVDFEPARGSEANKTRPGVIVSSDALNRTVERLGRGVITVVPITSNTRRIYPFQIFLPATESGLHEDSKAQAEQIRAVSFDCVDRRIGRVPPHLMEALDGALRLHLAL